jgi:hypothetical protein
VSEKYGLADLGVIFEDETHYLTTQSTFDDIADYTQSRPTGPRPGRVYKKNHGWPITMDDNWFVYVCRAAPDEPGAVDHFGKPVLLVES